MCFKDGLKIKYKIYIRGLKNKSGQRPKQSFLITRVATLENTKRSVAIINIFYNL